MDLVSLKSALAKDFLKQKPALPVHVATFCLFISPWQAAPTEVGASKTSNNYQDIAALGFQLIAGDETTETREAFLAGVRHLAGRSYFASGRAPRFEIDGIALLGVAAGYRATGTALMDTAWLDACLEKSITALGEDIWQASLVRAAMAMSAKGSDWSGIDPTLSVSLRAALGKENTDADRAAAWQVVIESLGETEQTRRASFQGVFQVCAEALARLPVHGAGIAELVELLEGVSQSMSHWTYETKQRVRSVPPQLWEMEHEYHVQNLLWTLLRPIFPDLVDEESLKKLGHTTPRADLGIPSLNTIIEVKYMRDRGQAQLKKVTDEVAADHSLYLHEGTGYTSMIVFIWDESRQTEEYKTLEDGLESLEGIEKVVILPRPSKMERSVQ